MLFDLVLYRELSLTQAIYYYVGAYLAVLEITHIKLVVGLHLQPDLQLLLQEINHRTVIILLIDKRMQN